MTTQVDLRTRLIDIVKDEAGKISNPEDYDRIISAALNRYSKHRPAEKVADIAGNGTHDYDLPGGWIDEFSTIKAIEYPIGDIPATLLDNDDYDLYQTPTAKKIRLKTASPTASESFRLTFTVLRAATTLPKNDEDAFLWLAAALSCEELANAFAQFGDSTIAADSVDYKDKSYRFAARAKSFMKLYKEHMGLREEDSVQASSAVADFDSKYPGGRDRLTHPRWARERR